MWAPADLFGPGLSALLLPLKGTVSYFYEHPVVLAAVLILVSLVIALSARLRGRRSRGT